MRFVVWMVLLMSVVHGEALPVRGLHVGAPKPEEIAAAVKFIREALPKEGVNTLVLEINYRYQFTSRPEVADSGALSREDVKALVAAAREAKVRLIPLINFLGHQSWAKTTFGLLRAHPELDETPGLYPDNAGIYCRSYCPRHPELHAVLFDLMDELLDVFEADAFHAGLDEVFLLGEDACPRCRGANRAELFAAEVKALRDHAARKKAQLWIWGDRLLDGELTGVGKWEGSANGTAAAIAMIPRDVVINDWHYEAAHPTAALFALQGFPVVTAPWRKAAVALRQLDQMTSLRRDSAPVVAERALGMLQTTWVGFGPFLKAYQREEGASAAAVEAAACFRELFREMRASTGAASR